MGSFYDEERGHVVECTDLNDLTAFALAVNIGLVESLHHLSPDHDLVPVLSEAQRLNARVLSALWDWAAF